MLLGQGLLIGDLGAINLSIPTIRDDLGASDAEVQLVLALYSLAFAVLLVTAGRLGDTFGPRRVFLAGLAGCTIAATLTATAGSPPLLVGARALAGVAAALVAPQVLAVIQVVVAPADRPRALAAFGAVSAVGMVITQLGGGLLLRAGDGGGWRWLFALEAAGAAVALVAAARALPGPTATTSSRLDVLGVGLLAVGLGLLVYPLIMGRSVGWAPWVWVCLAGSVPVLGAFLAHEHHWGRTGRPALLDLSLFQTRSFAVGMALALAFAASVPPILFLYTLLVQTGLGYDAFEAGAMFAVTPVAFFAASTLSSRAGAALGRNVLVLAGAGNMLGTVVLVVAALGLGEDVGPWSLVPGLVVSGFAQGLLLPNLLGVTLADVPAREAGAAGGAFSTIQQVAIALGVAVVGLVFAQALDPAEDAAAHAHAFGIAALVCMVPLQALVAVLPWLLPSPPGPHGRRGRRAAPVVDVAGSPGAVLPAPAD